VLSFRVDPSATKPDLTTEEFHKLAADCMGRKPKISYAHLMPKSAVLDNEVGIQESKERCMAKQKLDPITQDDEFNGANGAFDLFTKNEMMWSPYWSVAKALLRTQRNTFAYLEANRRLLDAIRTFVRQEQNLALEISDMVLKTMSAPGLRPNSDSISPCADINGAFDRALAGIRELGEFWIDAQMRSINVMRSQQDAVLGGAQESALFSS
jgi:hypothetical protein